MSIFGGIVHLGDAGWIAESGKQSVLDCVQDDENGMKELRTCVCQDKPALEGKKVVYIKVLEG